MYVVGIADVDDHGLPGTGLRESHSLRFAQFGPLAFGRESVFCHEIGQLHPIKREIVAPFVTPVPDQVGKQGAVAERIPDIVFALIPDRTFDAESDERIYH